MKPGRERRAPGSYKLRLPINEFLKKSLRRADEDHGEGRGEVCATLKSPVNEWVLGQGKLRTRGESVGVK